VIVTRRRRRPFPFRKLLVPAVAIALIAIALWWTPSRNAIATGPFAPVWNAVGSAYAKVAAPFTFAAQTKAIADDRTTIAKMQQQIVDLQTQAIAKDKRIAQLQSSLDDATAQVAAARAPSIKPAPVASGVPGFVSGDLASGASADARRTAQMWAAMDPDNAAKVIQKLPVSYAAHILALMSADSAGPILDALPPAFAAALTQEHPELRR
jgi:flagellar motility protein MotE (MotC chaperone)